MVGNEGLIESVRSLTAVDKLVHEPARLMILILEPHFHRAMDQPRTHA